MSTRNALGTLDTAFILIRAITALDAMLTNPLMVERKPLEELAVEIRSLLQRTAKFGNWGCISHELSLSLTKGIKEIATNSEHQSTLQLKDCNELFENVERDLLLIASYQTVEPDRIKSLRDFCAVVADSLVEQVEPPPPPRGARRLCA